jgi:hypothetical protein
MNDAVTPEPPATQRRTAARGALEILVFSLAVTCLSALLALLVAQVSSAEFMVSFVIIRWLVVGALIASPLIYRACLYFGLELRLPWAMRTPFTALVLTIESIGFDIASARLVD